MTKYAAGVECFIDVHCGGAAHGGCLNSRNLTNEPTVFMNRSDDQIKTRFQVGTRPTGQHLVSVMPYWIFRNFTDNDARSIVIYLRTRTSGRSGGVATAGTTGASARRQQAAAIRGADTGDDERPISRDGRVRRL